MDNINTSNASRQCYQQLIRMLFKPCSMSSLVSPWPRNYPAAFGQKLASLFKSLINDKAGMPAVPPDLPSAESSFDQMVFDDTWKDAEVVSLCHWLRGGTGLRIPSSFRPLLPTKLWSSKARICNIDRHCMNILVTTIVGFWVWYGIYHTLSSQF